MRELVPDPTWNGERLEAPPLGLLAVWLAGWAATGDGHALLHVASGERRGRTLAAAVRSLAPASDTLLFPPWDCLPYDRASPSHAVMGERIATLRRLAQPVPAGGRIVVTTVDAMAQRVPPREALAEVTSRIVAGAALDLEALRRFLLRTGYVLDERVDEPGEAALRGAVADLYPATSVNPYRIELEDGRVVSIRPYDALTQRSLGEVAELVLAPASEALLPPGILDAAEKDATAVFPLDLFLAGLPEASTRVPGSAHRLPLLYPRLETLLDRLPAARLALDPAVDQRFQAFAEQVRDAFAARRALRRSEAAGGGAEPLLDPGRLYLDEPEWRAGLEAHACLRLEAGEAADARALPALRTARDPRRAFQVFVEEQLAAGARVVVAAGDERDRRRLGRLVEQRLGQRPGELAAWGEALNGEAASVAIVPVDLPGGFVVDGLAVVAAADVLPPRAATQGAVPARRLLAAADLRPGDLVVHADHGIGRLLGLEVVEAEETPGEHLVVEHAGGERLLVPVLELDRIWRYGAGEAEVSLDRVDGEAWQARREEVAAQIAQTARELLRLAAERAERSAPALDPPREAMARFVRRFAYEPTDDQTAAIEATLADLARGRPPMDRLVCGDVGFGKTEVALRAAAAAALNGRQVALLAPTTVLVRQHLETFRRRFAGLGVRVEQLSRLARTREAGEVRRGLADGTVKVVIGTHALALPQVRFKDLALVVIDEEQRFGTRHKEALRRLRQGVHVLAMTATPIPRTLQSALAGIQELSVLATPPVRRQPVRTFVLPFDPALVRDALLRERRRGGRSFVVVPRIADIGPMAGRLAGLAPELDIVAAHGQMPAEQLDDAVLAFAGGEHDVLLTTSIIETGLDIPGADTMIVWRPDRFGIAQLHQLRGRVGRGRERAVAYLLHDPEVRLPPATGQRLKTLATFEGLGAGFAISARDLDLRGAGDLLGSEQAGHVKLIGTGLYQHLLEQALRRARGEAVGGDWTPELRLGTGAAIPPDYVPEPELRLDLYARLARLDGLPAVDELALEIADRFGPPPEPVTRLLALAAIRERCRALEIARLEAGPKAAAVVFHDPAKAPTVGDPLRWSGERLLWDRPAETVPERLAAAAALLDRLEAAQAASGNCARRPSVSR